jgi:LysR family transcriptional regulator of gallate degradation
MGSLRQHTIFCAVVQSGSAGGAARLLGLSQPAVSHAIARLESQLGVTLLDRGQEGSIPTPVGALLNRRVERQFEQIDAGIADICSVAIDSDRVRHKCAALTSTQAMGHLAVAGYGSFRAAARMLAISEPALQRTVRELERMLGIPLYERKGQQIVVTAAGARLATALQLGLAEIEQARDEIEASRGLSAGRVTLACLPLMPKSILATAIGRLVADYPSVQVSLEEGSYDRLIGELQRGKLDMLFGALREGEQHDGIESRIFFEDPYVAIARPGHPLGKRPDPEALAKQGWVAPPTGTPRRTALEAFFATLPYRPRIVLETASVAMMMATLVESDCLCLSSRLQAKTDFALSHFAILDVPFARSTRHVGITLRSTWLPTLVQRALLAFVEAAAAKL